VSLLVFAARVRAAGDAVTRSLPAPPGSDDWLLGVPTSSRPNLSSWLNKESYQLQQAGQRYRVNAAQCPVTSSSHLRDVTGTGSTTSSA